MYNPRIATLEWAVSFRAQTLGVRSLPAHQRLVSTVRHHRQMCVANWQPALHLNSLLLVCKLGIVYSADSASVTTLRTAPAREETSSRCIIQEGNLKTMLPTAVSLRAVLRSDLCAHTCGVCRSSRTTMRTKPILSLKLACCPISMSSFDELQRRCERARRDWPFNIIDVSLLSISSLRLAATSQCTFSAAQKSAEYIRNFSVQITAYLPDSNPDPAHIYFSG